MVNRYRYFMKAAIPCIFALLLFTSPFCAPAAERDSCVICGMYLDIYAKTRWTIILDNGSFQSTCSLACAAKIIQVRTGHIRNIKVADFRSGALIDARSAFFLEGSDIPGVMSYTSRIAFPSKEAARDFRKKHGGRIIPFDEALQNQLKERE